MEQIYIGSVYDRARTKGLSIWAGLNMYTLKITNYANKKTELSEHTFFFGAIFKALVSVAKIFGILLLDGKLHEYNGKLHKFQ